jgi:Mrp family chromosome partitioning ATPase/capsular polysaccharide biosynthesis protein
VNDPGPAGIDVRHYVALLRRQILWIVLITVALTVVGYVYSASKTPFYEASAQLLYVPQLNVNDPLSQNYTDPTVQELQLQSAVTYLTSPPIHSAAMTLIDDPPTLPEHSVSVAITTSDSQASSPIDNGVAVTVDSTSPVWSAKIANAYANAFVNWTKANDLASLEAAERVLEGQLKNLQASGGTASADYTTIRQDLTQLQILASITKGNFQLAVPATPPSAPYAPKPKRSAAMAGVLGLFLAVGFAFLREKLDTRLHNSREVSEIIGLPVIGRIGKIPEPALARDPIVVAGETDGRAAESIRVLRSNLQFASLGEKKQVFVVMSAQMGEGKTLLTANLAASFALSGKKVVLVDADLRRPRVHSIFGVRNQNGVSSVVAGFCGLDEALHTFNFENDRGVKVRVSPDGQGSTAIAAPPRLTLMTAGPPPPNPGEMVASKQFATMIHDLSMKRFDYIFIDSPAFLPVGDAAALAAVADSILLLVNLKMTNKPTLEEARDFLAKLPPNKLGVVTVMDSVGKGERYHYYAQTS